MWSTQELSHSKPVLVTFDLYIKGSFCTIIWSVIHYFCWYYNARLADLFYYVFVSLFYIFYNMIYISCYCNFTCTVDLMPFIFWTMSIAMWLTWFSHGYSNSSVYSFCLIFFSEEDSLSYPLNIYHELHCDCRTTTKFWRLTMMHLMTRSNWVIED